LLRRQAPHERGGLEQRRSYQLRDGEESRCDGPWNNRHKGRWEADSTHR